MGGELGDYIKKIQEQTAKFERELEECDELISHVDRPADKGIISIFDNLGPVVQSIVTLKILLRGQLIKCFTTLQSNTLIFLLKNERSF